MWQEIRFALPNASPPQFRHAPDFGKVAVNGAWEQAVSFRPGEFLGSEEIIAFLSGGQEVAHSAVGKDLEHDKALEFSYANGDGSTHWIALPVSHHSKQLDREMVAAALAR